MSHIPVKPNKPGLIQLKNIDLQEIVPFIDWVFFFMAWRMSGKYDGIESVHDCESCKKSWLYQFPISDRPKAEEALKLFKDAREMLWQMLDEKIVSVHASFGIFPAYAIDDDICIENEGKTITLPMLRQQHAATDGFCYSLADFVAPKNDYVGAFATTIQGVEAFAESFEKDDDVYHSILVKTLSDRLAEAAAEAAMAAEMVAGAGDLAESGEELPDAQVIELPVNELSDTEQSDEESASAEESQ